MVAWCHDALTVGKEDSVSTVHRLQVVAREALAQPVQRVVAETLQIALRHAVLSPPPAAAAVPCRSGTVVAHRRILRGVPIKGGAHVDGDDGADHSKGDDHVLRAR